MAAVITDQKRFETSRQLRDYQRNHALPIGSLSAACLAARRELDQGRTIAVAVSVGIQSMRTHLPQPTAPARA